MKLSTVGKNALPAFVGLAALGLTIRYFGDKPIISDIKEGLKGNVNGWFK